MRLERHRQRLVLETAEGIELSLPLAGPFSRSIAWLIDMFCIVGAASFAAKSLGVLASIHGDLGSALLVVAYFVLYTGYSMGLEWKLRGQTIGKRLMRLRVVDAEGHRLSLAQVVIRNLLRAADMMPVAYAVGGACCLVTRHAQRLGDLAANTVVVNVDRRAFPTFAALADSQYNSIRSHPRLVARLRQALSPEQARVALDAVLRREELEPDARLRLFARMSTDIKEQVLLPLDCVAGISDERLVMNVVESLFNQDTTEAGGLELSAASSTRKPGK